jgi:hypothetical protein
MAQASNPERPGVVDRRPPAPQLSLTTAALSVNAVFLAVLFTIYGTVIGIKIRPWLGLSVPKPSDSTC